jgi:SAM-dependent methyltransferase
MDSTTPETPSGPSPAERTVRWYDRHAEEYAEWTRQIDLSGLRGRFLSLVPEGERVLDVGCGAGRDLKRFSEEGWEAVGIDPSGEMARRAANYAGTVVHERRAQEFEPDGQFGGIWACASLLHVPREELPAVFRRLAGWLCLEGVLYASFRAGEGQDQEARFFNGVGREEVVDLTRGTDGLALQEAWTTGDSGGRDEVTWTNLLAESRV